MILDQIPNLQNIDLLILGITNTAIFALGFIIFLNDRRSITAQTFLIFSLIAGAYTIINYLSYQFSTPTLALWSVRFVIFSALWYSFFLFQLFYVFPRTSVKFSKPYKFLLLPLVAFTSILTLTPFVFSRISEFSTDGRIAQIINGPGIILFGAMVIYLVGHALIRLFVKTTKATGIEKNQFQLVLMGAVITYTFLILFNFIFPAFIGNANLIPLAPIFTLPFIVLTAYAIGRYRLLNIKVIATEVLTFILAIVTLSEVLFAQELPILIFRLIVFAAVLGFGVLLIRSVRKEVDQRERLQKLSQDLAFANTELKRLDRAKSEFVSIASHQLRTPLTAMKGYLSLILEGTYGPLGETFQKPINNIYESNQRLTHLVNDLLSLSRIESGKIKLYPKQENLDEIVKSVIQELSVKAGQKNIILAYNDPPVPIPAIFVDTEKIRNVILNLIDNAIRYTKKGSITTTIQSMGKLMHITVTDTGEGMSKEEIAKLFESFSRGQAGRELSTNGAGLGLYIAKRFVQMHKGKIWAESAGKGKGSSFHIELPVRQQ